MTAILFFHDVLYEYLKSLFCVKALLLNLHRQYLLYRPFFFICLWVPVIEKLRGPMGKCGTDYISSAVAGNLIKFTIHRWKCH